MEDNDGRPDDMLAGVDKAVLEAIGNYRGIDPDMAWVYIACRIDMLRIIHGYKSHGLPGYADQAWGRWNAAIARAAAGADDPVWRQFLVTMTISTEEKEPDGVQHAENQDGERQGSQCKVRHGQPFREGKGFE